MEEQELYLSELLSICVRKGKTLVIAGLIFALGLGAWQLTRQLAKYKEDQYDPVKIEERYQAALEDYNKAREDKEKAIEDNEKSIENTQKSIADKQEYLDNSLWMRIDPYDKHITDIYLGFTDIDQGAWDQIHYSQTSVDFVYSKIRAQYTVAFNSMIMHDDLGLAAYRDTEDKYLRELISFSSQDGGMMLIRAIGATEQQSEELAGAVYDYFRAIQPTMARNSYGHSFLEIKHITRSEIDTGMESTQQGHRDAIDNYNASIDSYRETIENIRTELEEMTPPEREEGYSTRAVVTEVVKYAVIGFVAGLVVAGVCVLIWAIMGARLLSGGQMERTLNLTSLGTARRRGSVFERWADVLSGERRWPDAAQAVAYAVRKLETVAAPGSKLVLASTLRGKFFPGGVRALAEALEQRGYKVTPVGDALRDPALMDAVGQCDGVVLCETLGRSRVSGAADLVKQVKGMEKNVVGFVTV